MNLDDLGLVANFWPAVVGFLVPHDSPFDYFIFNILNQILIIDFIILNVQARNLRPFREIKGICKRPLDDL